MSRRTMSSLEASYKRGAPVELAARVLSHPLWWPVVALRREQLQVGDLVDVTPPVVTPRIPLLIAG